MIIEKTVNGSVAPPSHKAAERRTARGFSARHRNSA
jgi:hypothetical protein